MAEITTVHRAIVWYEADVEIVDAIENKAFDIAGEDVEVETMCGNACCSPHVMAESSSIRAVREWAKKLEKYIKRRKGAELLNAAPSPEAIGGDHG